MQIPVVESLMDALFGQKPYCTTVSFDSLDKAIKAAKDDRRIIALIEENGHFCLYAKTWVDADHIRYYLETTGNGRPELSSDSETLPHFVNLVEGYTKEEVLQILNKKRRLQFL